MAVHSTWILSSVLLLQHAVLATPRSHSATRTVIDAHVHLITTTNGLTYEWAKSPGSLQPPQSCPCRPPCLCNWTEADYHATSASSWNVDKVVFCEVDADPSEWLQEARWVQNRASTSSESISTSGPSVGAIIARPPPGFGISAVSNYSSQLDELQKLPLVVGLRPSGLSTNGTTLLELDALREAGSRGLVIDLNMPIATSPVEEIVTACPKTNFVIEHLGGAKTTSTDPNDFAAWSSSVEKLAKYPNIVCLQLGGVASQWGSIGYLNSTTVSKWVKAGIKAFGFERTCFEGNWFFNNWGPPHSNLEVYDVWASELMSVLNDLQATEAQIDSVLRGNSARVYRVQ